MRQITCTRRLEFDSGHRVTGHESKCRNVHGHRYRAEITISAPALDNVGRVVDFGVVKELVGAWIDDTLDHGYIAHPSDDMIVALRAGEHKVFVMPVDLGEPTAENLVEVIARAAIDLLPAGLTVEHVRLYETPNCWADWSRP